MTIKLDILSDPICPWCMIGKANLDAALAERPSHPFEIEWHPFQLNPDMPAEGMNRRSYLKAKFGGKDAAVARYRPVVEAAEAAGLHVAWDRIGRAPNTLDAHRLIHWAGLEGRQPAAVAALFRGYFFDGQDIGDPATLADVGEAVGMERGMVERLLDSDADRQDVASRDAHARSRGVSGVPTFLVGGRHVLTGAQPTELWIDVIDEISGHAEF